MKKLANAGLWILLAVTLSSCVPVLVAGAFYSSNQSKKACKELNQNPELVEKLKVPEFNEYYTKVCKQGKKGSRDTESPENTEN